MARYREFDSEVAIDKAIAVFWKHGYKKTSMQELLNHLNIGRGSFYNAFESKHAIFLMALDRYSALMLAHLRGMLGKQPLKQALAGVFQALIDTLLQDRTQRGCLMINAATELASHDPEVAARVNNYHEQCVQLFAEALAVAARANEISLRQDPHVTALFLINTMDGLRVMTKRTRQRRVLENIAETALFIVE